MPAKTKHVLNVILSSFHVILIYPTPSPAQKVEKKKPKQLETPENNHFPLPISITKRKQNPYSNLILINDLIIHSLIKQNKSK